MAHNDSDGDTFRWLTGYSLRELHPHDPDLGVCAGCGLPENPCPFHQLGDAIIDQALGLMAIQTPPVARDHPGTVRAAGGSHTPAPGH